MNQTNQNPTSNFHGSESCNPMQEGFDFGNDGEELAGAFALHPLGTWNSRSPAFAVLQHVARFQAAEKRVMSIVGPSRPLFDDCLLAEREAFAAQVDKQGRGDAETFSLWGASYVRREKDEGRLLAFIEHCEAHAGADYDGIVYKVRKELTMSTASMYVPGLGSLTVRSWAGSGLGLSFELHDKDVFFLESYLDHRQQIEVPYSVWGACYGAQKLAESGKGVASLPTFVVAGREYVQLGGAYTRSRREGNAWLVGSLADWRGPVFKSYQEHIAAYDAGTVQRGDNRGLLVKVRGIVCVLVSAAMVFDENMAADARIDCRQEDGGEGDFEGFDEEQPEDATA